MRNSTYPSARHTAAATLLFAAGLSVAAVEASRAVEGISYPTDIDQFRDIAAAQAIADGDPLRDPFYRGETIWYNPLLPLAVAAASRVGRVDIATAYVQAGPILNAAAPVAFFAMTLALFGPWTALLASASLLFSPPHGDPPWTNPTYSPWLFASNFSTALFYVGVLVCWHASRRRRPLWWAVLGITLGLTFLSHTAPALLLGCLIVASIPVRGGSARSQGQRFVEAALAAGLVAGFAIAVSSPLLWSIVGRYGLRVVNPAPTNWIWPNIGLARIGDVSGQSVTIKNVLAVMGAVLLARRGRSDPAARLVLAWVASAAALMAYGYLQQKVGFEHLPFFLPNYHAYLYLRGVSHVLAAVTVWTAISRAAATMVRASKLPASHRAPVSAAMASVLVVGLVIAGLPSYRERPDFHDTREDAKEQTRVFTAVRGFELLRSQTAPDAVVLASQAYSIWLVAPAGRSVVAVPRHFSNPYVDFDGRSADQESMLSSLLAHDMQNFREAATRYGVSHVVLEPALANALFDAGPLPSGVTERARTPGVVLFDLEGPESDPSVVDR